MRTEDAIVAAILAAQITEKTQWFQWRNYFAWVDPWDDRHTVLRRMISACDGAIGSVIL